MKEKTRLIELPPVRTEGFGLVAWLEKTRIQLPLKGVECRFQVCGDLVSVEIDQIFHQENRQPLDCLYTFPLPGDAAVYRCEMHINDRVIVARVEELERAIKLVREKKAAGHRTALVRMERDNLFTLELGNIAPGDVVVIRFAYFQTLTRLDERASFNIPLCPGVRYIPGTPLLRTNSGRGTADDTNQVPDASRISPPRIDKLHPDAAYLAIEGRIDHSKCKVADVRSPSHPLLVKDHEGCSLVSLVDRAAVPDCDMVLRWTEPASQALESAAWLTRHPGESFALVRLIAPKEVVSVKEHAQDVYFLVDRSTSMQGTKWVQACAAFRAFLKTLEPQDRAWATFFESQYQDLAEKPLPPGALLSEPAVQALEKIGTAGGTELLPALMHVLDAIQRHSKHRNTVIVLITDGQVGNEAAIKEVIRPMPQVRVHTFGIDDAVNDGFLKALAAQQRGTCYLVTPGDDIVATVSRLGVRLRRPVLTDIRLRGTWELPEASVPDLHASETLNLPLRGGADAREIEWEGKLSNGEVQVFRCSVVEQVLPGVPLLWARRRIERLISENNYGAAIELARQHNLVCDGTAFVAWDEVERIVVGQANLDLYQPALEMVGGCAPLQAFYGGAGCDADVNQRETFFSRIGSLCETSPGSTRQASTVLDNDTMLSAITLISTGFSLWRAGLEKDDLFRGLAVADELLGWLDQWAVSDPANRAVREEKLVELAGLMAQLRQRQEPQMIRLDAMRRWLEATLNDQPEFLRPVLVTLDRLASAAQTDHKQLVR
ncbi:MAG: VWA domain-containing protein [Pedosphaera sp.]|nr:VWA domain-containing protein [Pedosphaera sp.]